MAHEIIMPALGMAQETGLLVTWVKNLGDQVKAGEILMEVETDKSTMEVEAEHDGYLGATLFPEGTAVPVGQVVARIVESPGDISEQPSDTGTAKEAPETLPPPAPSNDTKPASPALTSTIPVQITGAPVVPKGNTGRVLASPKAKRLAGENGIDLDALRRSTHLSEPFHAADVEAYLKTPPSRLADGNKALRVITSQHRVKALAEFMSPDADVTLCVPDIVAVLAGHLWRSRGLVEDKDALVINLGRFRDGVLYQWSVHDPERMRFTDYLAHRQEGQSGMADLSILELSEVPPPFNAPPSVRASITISALRNVATGTSGQGDLIEIGLEYEADAFTPDAAAGFMDDLASLIEQPMRCLL